ncbi:unnamed protein product [Aphanomyces euteiches]
MTLTKDFATIENPHYLDQVSALEKRKLKTCRSANCSLSHGKVKRKLFDNTSAAEKERSELEEPDDDGSVEEPDDDGSVEEPSYNPGTPTKEHHSYNPGTPPKPVMPLVQKSQSIVDLRNATSGASRPADNQHVRLNKRIKLLGERDKGKSSIADAIANGVKVQSETQSQIAERFILLQESQINFEINERVRKRKVDEIFRQGEFMKSTGFSKDEVMKFVSESMKSLD